MRWPWDLIWLEWKVPTPLEFHFKSFPSHILLRSRVAIGRRKKNEMKQYCVQYTERVRCHWTCYISAVSSSRNDYIILFDVLCVRLGAYMHTPPRRTTPHQRIYANRMVSLCERNDMCSNGDAYMVAAEWIHGCKLKTLWNERERTFHKRQYHRKVKERLAVDRQRQTVCVRQWRISVGGNARARQLASAAGWCNGSKM